MSCLYSSGWLGIIPAYAGSTTVSDSLLDADGGSSPRTRGAPMASTSGRQSRWDHPRVRGEQGLSTEIPQLPLGIIPAYAGSTRNLDGG